MNEKTLLDVGGSKVYLTLSDAAKMLLRLRGKPAPIDPADKLLDESVAALPRACVEFRSVSMPE